MDAVLTVIALFYIAVRRGEEEDKWGLFTLLIVLFFMGVLGTLLV